MRMAVVETDGTVRAVVEIEPGAKWSPPEGCMLVEDINGKAEPGGSRGKDGFAPASRDAEFLAGSCDNEPEPEDEKIKALEEQVASLADKVTAMEEKSIAR